MRGPSTSANVTIFLLFFGAAAIEAVTTRDWVRVGFWALIGLAFVGLDRLGRRHRGAENSHTDSGGP